MTGLYLCLPALQGLTYPAYGSHKHMLATIVCRRLLFAVIDFSEYEIRHISSPNPHTIPDIIYPIPHPTRGHSIYTNMWNAMTYVPPANWQDTAARLSRGVRMYCW